MNKIIVPAGYMGSGSSAVTDLVREYENVNNDYGTLEYVFLHCPDGLFDLEDKLLIGNNAIRSDEAVRSFLGRMKELYDKKYWWVGNYKKIIGNDFYKRSEQLVRELTDFKSDYYWYMQELPDGKMVAKLIVRKLVWILSLHKIRLRRPLRARGTCLCYPTEEKFYAAAGRYINDVLAMFDNSGKDLLLDQLLLPHNLFRVDNYFDDRLRVIAVERDPRDIFLSNKYRWKAANEAVPYSFDVREFCGQYRRIRESEKEAKSEKILRIKFEDMIFKYEETREKIIHFLQFEDRKQIRTKEFFNPDVSVNNVRLFQKKEYAEEADYIAENLREYLYDFPNK